MRLGVVLITTLALIGAAGMVGAATYAIRDLGVLPYGVYPSWGAGVNNDGYAVGTCTDISTPGNRRAVVWNPDHTMSD